MSKKRRRVLQVELDEEAMLAQAWAERLIEQNPRTLYNLYGHKRNEWVREKLGFLEPTDKEVRAIVGWLDQLDPYSPMPADSPPDDVPWLYR